MRIEVRKSNLVPSKLNYHDDLFGLNLFLDLLNVFCFARAKHLMGYKTQDDTISYEYNTIDNQNGHDFDETQFEIQDIYYIWYK